MEIIIKFLQLITIVFVLGMGLLNIIQRNKELALLWSIYGFILLIYIEIKSDE